MYNKMGQKFGLFRLLTTFFYIIAGSSALAQPLDAPSGEPILTIEGNITNTNVGDTAQFDRAMLESMGMVSFVTSTPWYSEPSEFEGVPLAELMERVGAQGTEVEVVALNDYRAQIPISDFSTFGTILALKRNGEEMPIRDKGPLFVVYPYDEESRLQNQDYYARSVWQVYKLIVQ
ncbi:molybdopterin-dependent oxidoreductase [Chelativorans sp. YIM 93263]|uniref:molybdopterin-dependent oxidoreductase n=1 Tax=Chelativorans sp. YIM 93263 TaxID=2906648 RepID=UPI002377F672|nr:molybdopterin-dependent oxidoreductase [Chelativorans sp. YIM 93263]